MQRHTVLYLLLAVVVGLSQASLDAMLNSAIDNCLDASKIEDCFRSKVIDYIGKPRSLGDDQDKSTAIVKRLEEIIRDNNFRIELPTGIFQGATLLFRPSRGMDFNVEFPDSDENEVIPRQARDMMKQKMLFPLLMLVKLKLKALTPILLTMVGIKAMKALVLSKIAILLVVGFLIVQICQKLGMAKMSMTPAMTSPSMDTPVTPPMPMYGPPSTSSYEPSGWEPAPAPGGPYARIYDTAAGSTGQQLAYSAYTSTPIKYKA